MINAKEIYYNLLSDTSITSLVGADNILDAYPDEIENYPCIIYLEGNQSDTEYADNKHEADSCEVQIHIFSKKLPEFATTSQIAMAIAEVMNNNLWHCSLNRTVAVDKQDDEHRVLEFNKSIYNVN